jgi:glycerol-3-phosphate acyltransferase PlsX
MILKAFNENFTTRVAGMIADPVLQKLRRRLEPDNYNGASMLGLNGIVVKSHGRSTLEGFYQAIRESMKAVSEDLPGILRSRLHVTLNACH